MFMYSMLVFLGFLFTAAAVLVVWLKGATVIRKTLFTAKVDENTADEYEYFSVISGLSLALTVCFFLFESNPVGAYFDADVEAYSKAIQVCKVGQQADCRQIALRLTKGRLTMQDFTQTVAKPFHFLECDCPTQNTTKACSGNCNSEKTVCELRNELIAVVRMKNFSY